VLFVASLMPTFKITVAYDGTDFIGWQRQASGVSIQGLLEDALREFGEGDVIVSGAGRTDAGVHALAQVAAFSLARDIAPDAVVRAMNVRLPDAVRVLSAEIAPAGFHPRFSAKTKTYRYRIWNGDVLPPVERRSAWHVVGALDVGAMQTAARILEGVHDFAAFQGTDSDTKTTERQIIVSKISTTEDRVLPGGALIEYEIVGNGFLRHMVRTIVGSLVEIGRGRHPPDWLRDVLASRDRTKAGRTAPAAGLFLVGVNYV
jgi:tRNA pseudouridine38-40 synthase